MVRKYLYGVVAFVLAFGILTVSLLRSSTLIFAFSSSEPTPAPLTLKQSNFDYKLAFPGKILPGSVFWPLKAIRDKFWYYFASGHLKRAELALLFSDKRLAAGEEVFKSGNVDLSVSVFDKAEKYLEKAAKEEREARGDGVDTSKFLTVLANSSLKHREVIEKYIASEASGEAKERLAKSLSYSKGIFRDASEVLEAQGKEFPKSPFDRD
jgi:hypothetical protein